MRGMTRFSGIRRVLLVVMLVALSLGEGSAQAAVMFDGSPGTAAPPTTLGSYPMTAFGLDATPLFSSVSGVVDPAGTVAFSPALIHYRVGNGWATWSNGYAGDVYYTGGATSVTLTLPAKTIAFYLYVEPNPFASYNVTATTQDGTTSGAVAVNGMAGARYFGFYVTGGSTLSTITVSSTVDFAVGEFGIARDTPASLCGLTRSWMDASTTYATSTPLQRYKDDLVETYMCADTVGQIRPQTSPRYRQWLIASYKDGVQSMLTARLLSPMQAAQLAVFASEL